MWTYKQQSGELIDRNGATVATGYSGHGDGVNNPAMQSIPDVGPIPQGVWTIGAPCDTEAHGPYVLTLTPAAGTDTFGRDGFLMHGDLIGQVGQFQASEGCIIMPPDIRHQVWNSGDHTLQVIAS